MADDRQAPLFLTIREVLEIHQDQLARYGGADGVRDREGLESALAQPRATFGDRFLHGDLFEMAAAYLFHLVKNHPFVDGNKRVGTVAAVVFLALNGHELEVDNDVLADAVLAVAEGETSKDDLAGFLRAHCG